MLFTGHIYKITGTCGLVYIGSTINFKKRMCKHKGKNNDTSSKFLTKPLHFEIIDSRKYKLKKTLRLVEQFYLDNNNTVNELRAYSSLKVMKEQKKQYFYRIRERKRKYYENNKEKLNKQKQENRITKIEINKQKRAVKYIKNRENILKKKKVKIKCECGCIIRKSDIARHKKKPKHINLLNKIKSL